MRQFFFLISILFSISIHTQIIQDDFEGAGTISTWYEDNLVMDTSFSNPFKETINTSNTVLKYTDAGGSYANVGFDVSPNFDLSETNSFSLKIYVPSSGITGSQNNQVSLKLQNNLLGEKWTTQSEIIKDIVLDQWQEVIFNFETGTYSNFDNNTGPPVDRTDFNRVVIQVNGEDNTDLVVAYIDDVIHFNTESTEPVYDYLVWSDDFEADGAVDDSKWFHQTQFIINGNSWANNEQQAYTDREENSYVSGNTLKIKAIKESFPDQGTTKQYTSARLNSKFAFKYGRVEVRAKLPSVAGSWPAIWLLGKNITETGGFWSGEFGDSAWPYCGEIDIMEPNIAKTEILGTWHWNNGDGKKMNTAGIPTTNVDTSQNWHIYSLVWTPESMKIYMDQNLVNQIDVFSPFDQEFYILLNVAMGGDLGGPIATNFTNDTMEIDYVEVYQETPLSSEAPTAAQTISMYPNPVNNLLNIQIKNTQSQQAVLKVFDMSGRMVATVESLIQNKKIKFNTSALSPGIYAMSVILDNGQPTTLKFIKN